MTEFDVRFNKTPPVSTIRFSDNMVRNTSVASTLCLSSSNENRLEIRDESFDNYHSGEGYLVIADQDHAENLIKALYKAIELGWLK